MTFAGTWNQVDDAVLLPPPARRSIPIVIAADGDRMLGLAARHADGWQTAWYGLPDERFERDRGRLAEACRAAGRTTGPELFVGLEVQAGNEGGDPHLSLDPVAIEDGLHAWAEVGAAHAQLGVWPATPQAFAVVLDGIARFRSSDRPPRAEGANG